MELYIQLDILTFTIDQCVNKVAVKYGVTYTHMLIEFPLLHQSKRLYLYKQYDTFPLLGIILRIIIIRFLHGPDSKLRLNHFILTFINKIMRISIISLKGIDTFFFFFTSANNICRVPQISFSFSEMLISRSISFGIGN